eukprot:CAMPEP_0173151084 /NCGR_PEP_ID=MMETSP1105-20130129/11362_1 /TAXON_ID=2985 /ORGANISM="Ochromonas sp., Strain BG-1" /LENGTH=837 /DNA_ID=CAMNT_0014066377 /DNA_START=89 /DNA_END=2602 /DNA_ORIENTATION=+
MEGKSADEEKYDNLLQRLSHWANETPDRRVWTFLNDKGEPVESYTYKELEAASDYLCDFLLNQPKLKKGDRVLLVFFPGLDFSAALLACFKAQLIAVPVFPPDPRRLKKDLHHFISIQQNSEATIALTNSQYNFLKKIEDIKNIFSSERWPDIRWLLVDDQLKRGKTQATKTGTGKGTISIPSPDTISFLQYTSGSTSEPKGVMISHSNLAHNLAITTVELETDQSTRNVSWLPQYHDMGLIGSYLGAIYCGGEGYYLSPISFLKDPLIWIKTISRFKATHTQAPNFAYALVARKYNEQERFKPGQEPNLSSLRHAINAAEPVDFNAIMNFYEIFINYGLKKDVIYPTYGLAEHTVFVCSGGRLVLLVKKTSLEKGTVEVLEEQTLIYKEKEDTYPPEDSQLIVGCGIPGKGNDVHVVIVDSDSQELTPSNRIGEIWISSKSKAKGYWNHLEQSKHDFEAEINDNDHKGERYLRSGDLGFLYKNELFICGRLKDLIIVGGTNHYPQDIERTVERGLADQLRAGCSAAFSLHPTDHKKSEEVIYIAEVKEGVTSGQFDYIVQLCRELVSIEHGIGLKTVCLLETRTIPKTTSGKIARAWCRKAFLEKKLAVIYRSDAEYSEYPEYSADEVNNNSKGVLQSTNSNGYLKVGVEEGDEGGVGGGGNDNTSAERVRVKSVNYQAVSPNETVAVPRNNEPKLSAEEIRRLSIEEIVGKLENTLIQISSVGPSKLNPPLDRSIALTSFGLDSMTIVQFKGVLENRYHCDIPDEFVFSPIATLKELAAAVKLGHLSDDQRQRYENVGASNPSHNINNNAAAGPRAEVVVVNQRTPCCPWFTCCY